jgi:transposase
MTTESEKMVRLSTLEMLKSQGLKYKEIAKIMSTTEKTVGNMSMRSAKMDLFKYMRKCTEGGYLGIIRDWLKKIES